MKDLRSSQMENLCQGTSAVTRYSVLRFWFHRFLQRAGRAMETVRKGIAGNRSPRACNP